MTVTNDVGKGEVVCAGVDNTKLHVDKGQAGVVPDKNAKLRVNDDDSVTLIPGSVDDEDNKSAAKDRFFQSWPDRGSSDDWLDSRHHSHDAEDLMEAA